MFLFIKLSNYITSILTKTLYAMVENTNRTLYKTRHNLYLNLINNNQASLKYKFYTFFTKSLFLYNYVYLSPYSSNTQLKLDLATIKHHTTPIKNTLSTYHTILNTYHTIHMGFYYRSPQRSQTFPNAPKRSENVPNA